MRESPIWSRLEIGASLSMQRLISVEDAIALMTEAREWGVWRWLTEKKKVRAAADAANAALGELEEKVKSSWDDDLWKAYRELEAEAAMDGNAKSRRQYEKAKEAAKDLDPKLKLAIKRVKEADDEAYRVHMDAEDTFDEAERRLSAGMAREGTWKAIDSWDLREKAIRKAVAVAKRKE